MKTVYYIRHGETEAGAQGLLAGSILDTPLNEKGIQQSHQAAAQLKGRVVDVIVASPLSRTITMAQIIAADIDYKDTIVKEPLLKERDFGSASGKPLDQALAMLDEGTAVGAESVYDLHKRVASALRMLNALPAEHIVIAGHAGFGRMLRATIEGIPPQDFLKVEGLHNAEIYQFTLD